MAKKQIKNYVFLPGAAGVGKIKVLDKIDQESILLITNTTDNTTLYNFGDGSKKSPQHSKEYRITRIHISHMLPPLRKVLRILYSNLIHQHKVLLTTYKFL